MSGKQLIFSVLVLLVTRESLAMPWWKRSSETADNTYPAEMANSCKTNECPVYSVIDAFDDYELRRYEPSVWVATNVTTVPSDFETAKRDMFWTLFGYISGNNTESTNFSMTAPVLKNISQACETCVMMTVMYFMIPKQYRNNPPAPSNPNAYIVNMPAMKVYVRYFGGRPSRSEKMTQLDALKQALVRDEKTYETSYFIEAGYDSPWTMVNRRNEMWLVATQ